MESLVINFCRERTLEKVFRTCFIRARRVNGLSRHTGEQNRFPEVNILALKGCWEGMMMRALSV